MCEMESSGGGEGGCESSGGGEDGGEDGARARAAAFGADTF